MSHELAALRVSLARVAQALEVDNLLQITDKPYEQLCALALERTDGWNDLAYLCHEKAQQLTTLSKEVQ